MQTASRTDRKDHLSKILDEIRRIGTEEDMEKMREGGPKVVSAMLLKSIAAHINSIDWSLSVDDRYILIDELLNGEHDNYLAAWLGLI